MSLRRPSSVGRLRGVTQATPHGVACCDLAGFYALRADVVWGTERYESLDSKGDVRFYAFRAGVVENCGIRSKDAGFGIMFLCRSGLYRSVFEHELTYMFSQFLCPSGVIASQCSKG